MMNFHDNVASISNNSEYFKLGFFGSSSFVLLILEDILQSENQSLAQIGIKQLKHLLNEKSDKNIEFEKKNKSKGLEEGLEKINSEDLQIRPNWWKSDEFLVILEFILEVNLEISLQTTLENENTILITNKDKFAQIKKIIDRKTSNQNSDQVLDQIPPFLQNKPKTCELICELNKKIKLELVITQPDRTNGKKVIQNPISEFAKNHNLPLEMPVKINLEIEEVKGKYELDCAIVASFGQILSSKVLQFPEFGIINWHPSLLPKYRGATPIQTALLENCKVSGLSWIKMTKGMDSGPIWLQIPEIIEKLDNFETFANKMGKLGAESWALPIIANLIEQIMNENKF